MHIGLVLTGGGARGAWQAGAIRALGEICGGPLPFSVVTGTSAGAINAAWVAAHAVGAGGNAAGLPEVWTGMQMSDVFRTDAVSMARIGAQWAADLGLGAFLGSSLGKALLDTAPLRDLLGRVLDMDRVETALAGGTLRGMALSATSYDRGIGVSFFDAGADVVPWRRRTRIGVRTRLGLDHVMASCAIPVFFPAVAVDGEWFGDGCVRQATPLSPALHLGADRIVALGVSTAPSAHEGGRRPYPSKARVASLLLDALFLDALDGDLERARRINRTLALFGTNPAEGLGLRPVPILALQPTVDLGEVGRQALGQFPAILRHLLAGLGASDEEGWGLVSYLAFEPGYTVPLAEQGYADTMARRGEVETFLAG